MAYDSRTERAETTFERKAQRAARHRASDDGRRERTSSAMRGGLERRYREGQ